MNFFRYIFLLVFALSLANSECRAQQIIWANKNKLDKRTDFTKVIGQNKHGVFILKHKNSTFRRYFILEHFDKKMNLLRTKTFKIPNCELEKIVVHRNGILFFTREYIKGSLNRILCQSIDSNMVESLPMVLAENTELERKIGDIRIEYNNSRDRFMLWYLKDYGFKTELVYRLLDQNALIKKGSFDILHEFQELYAGDACIDDSANLYVIYTYSQKFKSKTAEDFEHHLMACNLKKGTVRDELINNSKTFLSAYKLNYSPVVNRIFCYALTGVEDEEECKGYCLISLNCSDQRAFNSRFEDFDRKLVGRLIGVKNEQKGENLSKFKIKKLVPKTDGGVIVICERMFVTTQSDIFYVNGIPQSSYAKIFNNDEVLLLNLDSNGAEIWTEVINKNQSSTNDGGYYNGIVIMVNDDRIDILYNDKLNANADIIQVTYDEKGERNKKILINNEEYYALLIPSEYNQVTSNSMVLPINQNREFTYIKVLY